MPQWGRAFCFSAPVGRAAMIAGCANDRLHDACSKHPDRFTGMAACAPQDAVRAAREIERAASKLGMRAVVINSHTHGEYLDAPKFAPILEAAEALDVPIYLHPDTPPRTMIGAMLEAGLDGAIFGFGVETGMHALRLITSGTFDPFPKLQVIIGHMGEALPYWLYRLDFMHQAGVRSQRSMPGGGGDCARRHGHAARNQAHFLPDQCGAGVQTLSQTATARYDFVIVGAGSAGCAWHGSGDRIPAGWRADRRACGTGGDPVRRRLLRWKLTGTGILAGLPIGIMGFLRTDRSLNRPDLQLLVSPLAMNAHVWFPGWRKPRGDIFTVSNVLLHPQSRGWVKLRSADPSDAPRIQFNLFRTGDDRAASRRFIRLTRTFLSTPPADTLFSGEIAPGADVQSDRDIDAYVRARIGTAMHPVGTCAMGTGSDAVLDASLRVHGVQALRVADCSVMPTIVGGNTNAPAIMIAEKAADMRHSGVFLLHAVFPRAGGAA